MRVLLILMVAPLLTTAASATPILISDPSGLAAEVEFTLLNPTTLELRAKNVSTAVPNGFDEADQLLTGISWDFGAPGVNPGDPRIIGGSVVTGATSMSINFDVQNVGANADVSGEYGYGNDDGTGALPNFVSGNNAQATPFGGANLDGPSNNDGPQAGMVASPVLVPLNGLGAIQDEIIATLTIDTPLTDLSFIDDELVRVEFGSDAAFVDLPEPGTLLPLLVLSVLGLRRR